MSPSVTSISERRKYLTKMIQVSNELNENLTIVFTKINVKNILSQVDCTLLFKKIIIEYSTQRFQF